MKTAYQIHTSDNVATMLDDAAEGELVAIRGEGVPVEIRLVGPIDEGHKVALRRIAAGEPIVKFGISIGHATADVEAGAWVHLHDMASDYDARSSTLELRSGAPTDTRYE